MSIYTSLANALQMLAYYEKHNDTLGIERQVQFIQAHNKCLPSGGGFDNGTSIDIERSTPTRLVFETAYHHKDENGFYTGWTSHQVIVTPLFGGDIDVRVTGKKRDGIKEHIAEVFETLADEED